MLIKDFFKIFAYVLAICMIVGIITFSASVIKFISKRNQSSNKEEYTWKEYIMEERAEKESQEDTYQINETQDNLEDRNTLQYVDYTNDQELNNGNEDPNMIIGSKEEISRTYNFIDISKISIEHSTGTLILKEGKGEEFIVETQNVSEELRVEVNDKGELFIIDKIKKVHFELHLKKKKSIIIQIPKGTILDQIKIDGGVGDVEISDISSKKLVVNAGVGNFESDDITADEVIIHCGVGNMKLYHVNFKDTEINGGVGNIHIDGVIQGLIDLESGVGNIKVALDGNIEDYDIRGNKGIGSVRINGEKRESLSSSTSKYKIKIDCGVGDIRLDID